MLVSDYGGKGPNTITHEFNLDTFTSNQANYGGALSVSSTASASAANLLLYNSTFASNHAVDRPGAANSGQGGAVYIIDTLSGSGSASNSLTNDTFFENDSTLIGGAVDLALSTIGTAAPSAVLASLTVSANTADSDGDGLYVSSKLAGAVTLDNDILDGNIVTTQPAGAQDVTLSGGTTLTDKGYNLLGASNNNNFKNGVNNDILNNTTGLANQLALNGAPANYPQTLALTAVKGANSPGYETGDPALATSGKPLNQDERGKTRQASKVSIGAEDPDAT